MHPAELPLEQEPQLSCFPSVATFREKNSNVWKDLLIIKANILHRKLVVIFLFYSPNYYIPRVVEFLRQQLRNALIKSSELHQTSTTLSRGLNDDHVFS